MAGSSVSQGASQGTSASASSSFVPGYQEEPFLNAIAQHAAGVGDQVYDWAQQAYNNTAGVTNANMNNYLGNAQGALTQAHNFEDQYNQHTIPAINQQFREGDNYASANRQQQDMGAAASQVAQTNAANHANTVRDLQSYGLNTGDPSSGRYAALDHADAVQNAAQQAGAAQTARNQDIQMGQTLRNNAISNSQPWLGAANAGRNTAFQGITGAENAALGTANVGAALQQSANPYYQTASSLKYPPLGQASQSASQNSAQNASSSVSTDAGSSGGGGGSKSPTSDPRASPAPQPDRNNTTTYSGGGGSGGGPGASSQWSNAPGGGGSSFGDNNNIGYGNSTDYSGLDGGNSMAGGFNEDPAFGDWNGSGLDPYDAAGAGLEDFSSSGMGEQDSFNDYGGAGGFTDNSNGDWGTGVGDASNYASASDFGGGDFGGGDFGGGDGGGGGDFAQGGAIGGGIPMDGGQVPASASPSHGAVTDDIPAQLPSGNQIRVNADEFVIPKDVALWKGQEFFQKLIEQSRKARITAPAHPSQPGAQQQPAPRPAPNFSR